MNTPAREISKQGEGALTIVQLSFIFSIGCIEKRDFYLLLFQKLGLKLIDNCTSGSAPSLFIEISLLYIDVPAPAQYCDSLPSIHLQFGLFHCNCQSETNWSSLGCNKKPLMM